MTWADDMADTVDEIVMWALTLADDMVSGRWEWFVVSITPPFVRWWFLVEWTRCNRVATRVPGYGGKTAFYWALIFVHRSGSDMDESRWMERARSDG